MIYHGKISEQEQLSLKKLQHQLVQIAFNGISNVDEMFLPKSINETGDYAFTGKKERTQITYLGSNQKECDCDADIVVNVRGNYQYDAICGTRSEEIDNPNIWNRILLVI